MTSIFSTAHFWSFQVPNYDEILEFVNSKQESDINNEIFPWGRHCEIDRIPITGLEFQNFLQPSIDIFSECIGKVFRYTMYDPWINLYKKGFYQEIHSHDPCDLSCVLFLNTGENFSNFYFFNRYDNRYSRLWEEVLSPNQVFFPEVQDGTIIFFPSATLHGVSKHKSDIIRKTIACNLDLDLNSL